MILSYFKQRGPNTGVECDLGEHRALITCAQSPPDLIKMHMA